MTRSTKKDGRAEDAAKMPDPKPPSGLHIAGWGLLMFAGCRVIAIVLEAQSMAATVGQAVLVEWGSSRVNVVWSPPNEPMTWGLIARRIAIGAGIGFAAAAVLFGVLLANHGTELHRVSSIEASVLVLGFITAALTAWRDEMLFHGVTLRALEVGTNVAPIGRVLACAITSAGAAIGRSDATSRTVFSAALLGAIFGALWIEDRGAWKPWAANTAFRFSIGTLLSGGVIHSQLVNNGWSGGSAGLLGGTAAAVAIAPLAVLALVWTARRISPTGSATIR